MTLASAKCLAIRSYSHYLCFGRLHFSFLSTNMQRIKGLFGVKFTFHLLIYSLVLPSSSGSSMVLSRNGKVSENLVP